MSTLAHVFEAAGLATIVLSSIRGVVEKMRPPRALHCEFPLGRPLGKPLDSVFQRDVLARAFELLKEPAGPVLVDHPEHVQTETEPIICAVPPRFDPSLPAAVDEANGLMRAYQRTLERRGFSSVGRAISADDVPKALQVLHDIANGAAWKEAGVPGGNPMAVAHDIRTYYEEASLALVSGTTGAAQSAPGSRQIEAWYFESTEAGKLVLAARLAMKEQGAPTPAWFYMAPSHR